MATMGPRGLIWTEVCMIFLTPFYYRHSFWLPRVRRFVENNKNLIPYLRKDGKLHLHISGKYKEAISYLICIIFG